MPSVFMETNERRQRAKICVTARKFKKIKSTSESNSSRGVRGWADDWTSAPSLKHSEGSKEILNCLIGACIVTAELQKKQSTRTSNCAKTAQEVDFSTVSHNNADM